MKISDITKIATYLSIFFIYLGGPIYSAERESLEYYFVYTGSTDTIRVIQRNFVTGIGNVIDSIDTKNPLFPDSNIAWTHEIDWSFFEPVHRRIFFQEAFTMPPIRTHVYEIDTHRYFDLPYDNYMGEHAKMIVSPNAQYIIFTYRFVNDTSWSIDQYKTVILSGDSLNQISEKIGLDIGDQPQGYMSFIARNNQYLVNPQYLSVSDTSKDDAFVIYSLPALQPLDTLFYRHFQWQGHKRVWDVSDNGVLLVANKTDTTRALPPGYYAFVVSWPGRRLGTRFIPLAPANNFDAKLSPGSDEIDVLYPSEGKLRRYPVARGRMLGEIDVPQGSSFDFYGTDGNLYLRSGETNIVVDYHNNQIVRQFEFTGE
jgi:hypothetical protein